MKILELFGGIGACSKALERIGVDYEIADYVEIDKYAVKSFNAIHGTNFEPQDVTKWDKDMQVDLIMHGSPCQDFSVAGKNAGGDKNSGTRSSLMYETLRIVEKLKPKYVIWENVKNLLSKKHRHNFDAYIDAMAELGYVSKYQILNAKDYGVPQNRERVFTISCRHDGDSQIMGSFLAQFNFPEPMPLEHRLKDILEDSVDERYYLSDEQVSKIKLSDFSQKKRLIQDGDTSQTILSRDYKDPKCVRVGGLYDKEGSRHQAGSIYDPNGVCATLSTMQGGNQEPIIVASRGRGENNEQQLEPNFTGATNTLTSVQKDNLVAEPRDISKTVRTGGRGSLDRHSWDIVPEPIKIKNANVNGYRIRKLTPLECWRLMGFDDADYAKAAQVNSNTQLYKQAGNSIVVNVLEGILKNLLERDEAQNE